MFQEKNAKTSLKESILRLLVVGVTSKTQFRTINERSIAKLVILLFLT